tara:strand:+ start:299 stop:544 length:246 start_codon:yes stop_codon:yes gene_type:complete
VNVELAMIIDSGDKKYYVYGTYEEVENYADSVDGYVHHYFNHVNPSTVQANFNYIGSGQDPYQRSRSFDYKLNKTINIIKW